MRSFSEGVDALETKFQKADTTEEKFGRALPMDYIRKMLGKANRIHRVGRCFAERPQTYTPIDQDFAKRNVAQRLRV